MPLSNAVSRLADYALLALWVVIIAVAGAILIVVIAGHALVGRRFRADDVRAVPAE